MDKALESRLREAINEVKDCDAAHSLVVISVADAKRLLYRLIKENNAPHKLEYRHDPKRK